MGRGDALYAKLPVVAQHAAVSAFGAYWHWSRFGPGYQRYLKEYVERESFGSQQWAVFQRERLRALLKVASESVPYYQENWCRSEKAAAHAGYLNDLPFVEKDHIRRDSEAFVRRDVKPWRRLVFRTSGSTGTPVSTIWTVQELRDSLALKEARSARWAGVSFRMPRATFSGRMVEPDPESKGPFHRFNVIERQVYLSAFHLRPDTAAAYVAALRSHGIRWLTGYAVSYFLLARLIIEQKIQVPSLDAVITTSEKLTAPMRQAIQEAFKCPVYQEYNAVENAVYASECEYHRLHVSPDASVIEILRPDGTNCETGEVGEVVATCLTRDYQPLIRYRLGDLASWDEGSCQCGRAMPVLKEVVGRIEDVVTGPDGRQLVRFHGVFINQPHVREGQIIQETLNRIRVKVVPTDGFNASDVEDIKKRVHQRLGTSVEVIVEPVEQIPRSSAGKFQAVVSLLSA